MARNVALGWWCSCAPNRAVGSIGVTQARHQPASHERPPTTSHPCDQLRQDAVFTTGGHRVERGTEALRRHQRGALRGGALRRGVLAIYMNGIVQELLQLVRATAPSPDDDGGLWWADDELPGAGPVYRKLGRLLDRGTGGDGSRPGAHPVRRRHHHRHVGGRHQRRVPGQGPGHGPRHLHAERAVGQRRRHRQAAERRSRRRRRATAEAAAPAAVAAVGPAHALPAAEGARRGEPGEAPGGCGRSGPFPVRQPDRPVGHGDRPAGSPRRASPPGAPSASATSAKRTIARPSTSATTPRAHCSTPTTARRC